MDEINLKYDANGNLYNENFNIENFANQKNFNEMKAGTTFGIDKFLSASYQLLEVSEPGSYEVYENDGYPYILFRKNTQFRFRDGVKAKLHLIGGGGAGASHVGKFYYNKRHRHHNNSIVGGGGGGAATTHLNHTFKKGELYNVDIGKGGIAKTLKSGFHNHEHQMDGSLNHGRPTYLQKDGKNIIDARGGEPGRNINYHRNDRHRGGHVAHAGLGGWTRIKGKVIRIGGHGGWGGGWNFHRAHIPGGHAGNAHGLARFKIGKKVFHYGAGGGGGRGMAKGYTDRSVENDFLIGGAGIYGKRDDRRFYHMRTDRSISGRPLINDQTIKTNFASAFKYPDNFGAGGGGHYAKVGDYKPWYGHGHDGAMFIEILSIDNASIYKFATDFIRENKLFKSYLYKFTMNGGYPYYIFDNNKDPTKNAEFVFQALGYIKIKVFCVAGGGAGSKGLKDKSNQVGGAGGGGGDTKISEIISLAPGDKITIGIGKKGIYNESKDLKARNLIGSGGDSYIKIKDKIVLRAKGGGFPIESSIKDSNFSIGGNTKLVGTDTKKRNIYSFENRLGGIGGTGCGWCCGTNQEKHKKLEISGKLHNGDTGFDIKDYEEYLKGLNLTIDKADGCKVPWNKWLATGRSGWLPGRSAPPENKFEIGNKSFLFGGGGSGATPAEKKYPAIPITNGLQNGYNVQSWDPKTKIWRDIAGDGHLLPSKNIHDSDIEYVKKENYVRYHDNIRHPFDYLKISHKTRINFQERLNNGNWTVVLAMRYDPRGRHFGRILQGHHNTIIGFHGSAAGVVHTNRWVGNGHGPRVRERDSWILMIANERRFWRRSNLHGWGFYGHGGHHIGPELLHINSGRYPNEKSDFHVGEILIYNRNLKDYECGIMRNYLENKYLRGGANGTMGSNLPARFGFGGLNKYIYDIDPKTSRTLDAEFWNDYGLERDPVKFKNYKNKFIEMRGFTPFFYEDFQGYKNNYFPEVKPMTLKNWGAGGAGSTSEDTPGDGMWGCVFVQLIDWPHPAKSDAKDIFKKPDKFPPVFVEYVKSAIKETLEKDKTFKGPRGPMGRPGFAKDGDKGNPGQTGARGEKGDKGDRGDKGEVGPEGKEGTAGLPGQKGDAGPVGPMGPKGDSRNIFLLADKKEKVDCAADFSVCDDSCKKVWKVYRPALNGGTCLHEDGYQKVCKPGEGNCPVTVNYTMVSIFVTTCVILFIYLIIKTGGVR